MKNIFDLYWKQAIVLIVGLMLGHTSALLTGVKEMYLYPKHNKRLDSIQHCEIKLLKESKLNKVDAYLFSKDINEKLDKHIEDNEKEAIESDKAYKEMLALLYEINGQVKQMSIHIDYSMTAMIDTMPACENIVNNE